MTENQVYYIVLLRHAESTGNSNGLFQGHSDFELSEQGMHQAQRLAERWKTEGISFDRIISSPLLRARQTAEVVATELAIEVELQPDWMERDIGGYSGKPASEVTELFPKSPYHPVGQTGDSQWDLYLRAGRAIGDLLRRPPGRYLIVAHGGIINFAFYALLGIPPSYGASGPRFILSNAAFAELTYSPEEHAWRLHRLNDHGHLSPLTVDPVKDQNQLQVSQLKDQEQVRRTGSGYAKSGEKRADFSSPYSIRQANISDINGIMQVFAEADELHSNALPEIFQHPLNAPSNRNYYTSLLSDPNARLFVADINGEIAGALYASIQESSSYPLAVPRRYLSISILSVKDNFRRRGIGLALMEEAHDWARQQRLKTVELIVWEFNEAARHFYENLGYTTSKRRMWLEIGEGE